MKKIIITLVTIVLTSTPVFLFSWYGNKNQETSVKKRNTVENKIEVEKSEDIDITESSDSEEVQEEKEETSTSNSKKSISNAEISTKESEKQNNNPVNNPQENKQTVQSEPIQQPQNNEPVQETQPSVSQPWDVYGKTEYQYYNEPLYNWERVDFSVSDYGSEQAAYNACTNYGDNYEPYKNGQVLYSCSRVVSASGRFLGIMFSTEKLN